MLKLFIDGAARGNPGEGGAGVVVLDSNDQVLEKRCRHLGDHITNNRAEYEALLFGLEVVKGRSERIDIYSDSELLVKQMKGEYKVKNGELKALHLKAKESIQGFSQVHFYHVPREQNQLADKLANEAIDQRK